MAGFFKSFLFAFRGIGFAWKGRNFKVQVALGILAIILGFVFTVSCTEWLIIILCIGLVLSLETANSALEYLTDLVSPEQDPLAGKAKDCAAGAVGLASMASLVIGLIIFIPKFWLL